MKTKSRSTGNPRRALYVGLTLIVAASLALEGEALRLLLDPKLPVTGDAIGAALWGALFCLLGGALIGIAILRERRRPETSGKTATIFNPRGAEEAAALAHAQKMEALGLLAGGVAHDFNNLLHVIRNSLEILQRHGPEVDSQRHLEVIRSSADRAAALTRQLLAFSRRQPPEARPLDPNDLVTEVTELLRHSLGERITLRTVLGQEVWSVAADASQLETALINLAVNARDAMSHAGLLTIETANATLDGLVPFGNPVRAPDGRTRRVAAPRGIGSREARREADAGGSGAGQYVMIAVSDTGSGMSPEIVARACEPFFTTKEPGRGTGLGLSQVAGFARQSGGYVRISSEPGTGTTVRLYLPKSRPSGAPSATGAPRSPTAGGQRREESGQVPGRRGRVKGAAAPGARSSLGFASNPAARAAGSAGPQLAVGGRRER